MNATVPPPPAVPALPTQPIAWEDPSRGSWFERFFETVKSLATAPGDAFRSMPTEGGIGKPLVYTIMVGWIGFAIAIIWNVMFQSMWIPFMDLGEAAGSAIGISIIGAIGMIVIAPIFVILGVFIASAILHLMLMIVGAANNGFEATVRIVCYSQTAQLANIIPLCGGVVALIWGIILYIVGIAAGHETTHGKAVLAVLLPVVLCCAFTAVMFFVFMGVVAAQAQ